MGTGTGGGVVLFCYGARDRTQGLLHILGKCCSTKQYPLPLNCRFLVCRILSSNSLEKDTQGGTARNQVLFPHELKAFMGTPKALWVLPSSVEPAGNISDSGANPSPEGCLWEGCLKTGQAKIN